MVRWKMIPFSVVSYIIRPDITESAYFWSAKKYESNEIHLRDRPFNLQGGMDFCFVQIFFFGQQELEKNKKNCRAMRDFFSRI